MIIELKDCEKWIEEHKTWVLPTENGFTTPLVSYGAKSLLDTVVNYMLPELEQEEKTLTVSFDSMVRDFWDFYGGVQPIEAWCKMRNSDQIIFDMITGEVDTCEIVEALYPILRLDPKDENSKLVIKLAIQLYNSGRFEESAKIHDYEDVLKGYRP